MAKKSIHVVPNQGDWGVKIEGNGKLSKVFNTQEEAINYGRDRAINSSSELFIHNRKGQIRERNSYGDDLFLPRG
ncbi:MAG: DUF2188 domain-containing protein [Chitinophagaceae bacterium]|nr:DUF2188 domain-containing protein [Chitinophagaceae bacterium]